MKRRLPLATLLFLSFCFLVRSWRQRANEKFTMPRPSNCPIGSLEGECHSSSKTPASFKHRSSACSEVFSKSSFAKRKTARDSCQKVEPSCP